MNELLRTLIGIVLSRVVAITIGLFFVISMPLAILAAERWTPERAAEWYAAQPWLVGCNFGPSTAINQLEMWQADTFDPETIDRELGWAKSLGMNTVRVFLHELPWQEDQRRILRASG